jgi:hypothetical protein
MAELKTELTSQLIELQTAIRTLVTIRVKDHFLKRLRCLGFWNTRDW